MTFDSELFDGDAPVTIPKRVLAAVFDLATTSMDFASGFMTDEDVVVLREVAGWLGVDPNNGTPQEFLCKFNPHEWRPEMRLGFEGGTGREVCRHCRSGRGDYSAEFLAHKERVDAERAHRAAVRRSLGLPDPVVSTSFSVMNSG